MIDLRYVKKLIEMLDGSSVDSIEISSDKGMKIRISKSPQQRGDGAGGRAVPMAPMMRRRCSAPAQPTPAEAIAGDRRPAARAGDRRRSCSK